MTKENKSIGLGDTIKKVTDRLGIKQCGKCKKRQEKLNKMFPYKSEKHRQNHLHQMQLNRQTAIDIIKALRGKDEPEPTQENFEVKDK